MRTTKVNRQISETTLIKCIVSYKVYGYFGKSFTPLTKSERCAAVDEMIARNWLDEQMNILPDAQTVVLNNLNYATK